MDNNFKRTQTDKICDICNKSGGKDEDHGGIRTKAGLSIHYFCLLLADIPQRGSYSDGILGFLIRDIRAGISLTKEQKCCYCNEIGASVKCNSCRAYFHVLCGVEKKCRFRFIDKFNSYCHLHHNISHNTRHSNEYLCFICLQMMGEYHPITSIMPKCCNSVWMHLNCVQKYALSVGYYLKCLLCASADFRDEARELSIFVPDRDAVLEMEKRAYAGLHEGYSWCDVEKCLCPKGRKYSDSSWNIIVCSKCGASGTHARCNTITIGNEKWLCKDCSIVLSKTYKVSRNQSFEYSLYLKKSQFKCAEQFSIDALSQAVNNVKIKENQEEHINIKSTSNDTKLDLVDEKKKVHSLRVNTGAVSKITQPLQDCTRHSFYDGKKKEFAKKIIAKKNIYHDDFEEEKDRDAINDDILHSIMTEDLYENYDDLDDIIDLATEEENARYAIEDDILHTIMTEDLYENHDDLDDIIDIATEEENARYAIEEDILHTIMTEDLYENHDDLADIIDIATEEENARYAIEEDILHTIMTEDLYENHDDFDDFMDW